MYTAKRASGTTHQAQGQVLWHHHQLQIKIECKLRSGCKALGCSECTLRSGRAGPLTRRRGSGWRTRTHDVNLCAVLAVHKECCFCDIFRMNRSFCFMLLQIWQGVLFWSIPTIERLLTCYIDAAVCAELQSILFCSRFSGMTLFHCFHDPVFPDRALVAAVMKNGSSFYFAFCFATFRVLNRRFKFTTFLFAHNLSLQHSVVVVLLDFSNTIRYFVQLLSILLECTPLHNVMCSAYKKLIASSVLNHVNKLLDFSFNLLWCFNVLSNVFHIVFGLNLSSI